MCKFEKCECVDCIWQEKCACSEFLSEEDYQEILEAEYRADLHMREKYYRKLVEEFE